MQHLEEKTVIFILILFSMSSSLSVVQDAETWVLFEPVGQWGILPVTSITFLFFFFGPD